MLNYLSKERGELQLAILGQSAHASFWLVDTFDESLGNPVSAGLGQTQSITVPDLVTVAGGERYYQVTTTAGLGVQAQTAFFFGSRFFYNSFDNARGNGMLSYGFTTPLNIDYYRNGLITAFVLREFSADGPGQTGTMTLRIHSATGTGSVSKAISTLIGDARWEHEEFDAFNVDFSNVQRLDLIWGNFTADGADFSFSSFQGVTHLPEPGTMVMMFMAGGLLMVVRRRYVRREAEPQDEAPEPPLAPSKTNIYYHARNAA